VRVLLPRFDVGEVRGGGVTRGVPARRVGGHLVTTVFDRLLAQYGVGRDGLPGEWPSGYDDPQPHARVAGAAHRRRRRPGDAGGAGVRAQRAANRGAAR
jgi:nitrate reductase alpha subunit